jgi:CheY-like chemotaxis protein
MKKHILTVDDEPEIRDLLAAVLTSKGYRVTAASSGVEAERVVKAEAVDLIISDLQMEDADGLELIDQLKQIQPKVPAILLTGVLFDPEVVRDNISKKVSCYIDKTAPLTRILEEIQRLIGGP